jgi:outer membrane immunogenic protein
MKKVLLGIVALAALGVPAMAADLGGRPVANVPAFSWTGCHIGGLVGYEWGRDNGYSTTASSNNLVFAPGAPGTVTPTIVPLAPGQTLFGSFEMSGFNGGGYAGCDYQFGAFVVGVEGDWSSVNKSGQSPQIVGAIAPLLSATGALAQPTNPTPVVFAEAQERWYATLRGRLGYAVDRWLFFVSGGAAWTKIDSSQFQVNGPATNIYQFSSDRRSGWTVGAGVDYAPPILKGNWTVRVEYLYVRIDDYTTSLAQITGSLPTATNFFHINQSTRLDDHVVRFGLAYKFGGFARLP